MPAVRVKEPTGRFHIPSAVVITSTNFTGDARADILHISAVHPIREEAMSELLRKNRAGCTLLDQLTEEKKVRQVRYDDKMFWKAA